jgi:hypothetical protein
MRFMMMIRADQKSETGAPPDPKLVEAIGRYTVEMMKAGVVLMTGGLGPSMMGARVVASDGTLSTVDGPFVETKELIAGFAIIQAKSKEEAVVWGHRFMKVHQEACGAGYEGVLEIRPLFGPEDFAQPNA